MSTRKILRGIYLVGATAGLTASLFTGQALAASNSYDVSGMFEHNECTGEFVELSGRVHLVTNSEDNGDGTFSVKVHMNTQGVSGTGVLTGDPYRFNEGTNEMGEFDTTEGGTVHMVGHEEFIHLGEGGGVSGRNLDDEHIHFNVAVTVGPDGAPITTFVPRVECR